MGALKYYNETTSQWEYITNNPGDSDLIFSEEMYGTVNGTNATFTTSIGFSSISVYKNGLHMRQGSTNDYIITGDNQITFNSGAIPMIGSTVTASYNTKSIAPVSGSNSFIRNEVPIGTINGTNTVFTTLNSYVAFSLEVYVNGVKQSPNSSHFVETNNTLGTFTLSEAPVTGDLVTVAYQHSLSVSGNADTVDGQHASMLSPIGIISPFGGLVAPSGWLLCDGDIYGEEEYPALFQVIGYNYGGIPGAFAVPNLAGKVPVGRDQFDTTFDALGETGGLKETRHGYIEQGLNNNNFQDTGTNYLNSAKSDLSSWLAGGGGSGLTSSATVRAFGGAVRTQGSSNTEVRHGRYVSTNLQPYQVVNYIIKAV